jgi:hypothetical protein
VTTTDAPETEDPDESITLPLIVDVVLAASAVDIIKSENIVKLRKNLFIKAPMTKKNNNANNI